jgi:hypothetical protein
MTRRPSFATIVFGVALTLSAGAAHAQNAPAAPNGPKTGIRDYSPPNYVFSPDIQRDVLGVTGAIGLQPFIDDLAWNTFIALNWPAPTPLREHGIPDRFNVIGGFLYSTGDFSKPTELPKGPTVWQTFKDTHAIYLNPPKRPSGFDVNDPIPPSCLMGGQVDPGTPVLVMTSKFSDVLGSDHQADGNRLIDQNGQNVWYEVRLNRTYYDYIVANEFYDSRKQAGRPISFVASSNQTSAIPTIKVKAAWKVMGMSDSKQPDDPKKFYTTNALLVDPITKKCEARLMGLVGLHIVMKTAQFPQWLWATFEHVDNAPDQTSGPQPGATYNFYNPSCNNCTVNVPPGKHDQTPTQVMRVTPIGNGAPQATQTYWDALKKLRPDNVWLNYMLVDAQWGQTPTPLGTPNAPAFLANTTLETYVQAPQQPNGCINCHGSFAGKGDLDFQVLNAYPRAKPSLLEGIRSVLTVSGVSKVK